MKTYKGRYSPKHPEKYKGNPTQIIYRSGWERRLMVYLDENKSVIQWSSEEIAIPYRSPLDNKIHRYFPDFYVKAIDKNGNITEQLLEVKPKKETREPAKKKRITKQYITEVTTWGKNQAKWKAAEEYCLDRGWQFKLITEDHLGIK
jgi:hypothetical protein